MPKDLHSYLDEIRKEYPEELIDVEKHIKPAQFEVTALLEHLTKAKRFPVVVFHDCEGVNEQPSDVKLISNVFARRERLALALDLPPERSEMDLSLHFADLEKNHIEPRLISSEDAPVKEQVFKDSVDVGMLPIVKHYEMDLSPVLTMACCLRDPDTGAYEVSFVKTFYKGPRKLGIALHSRHVERIFLRYEELGRPAPVINILGHHPAFYLGTLALTPFERDDYESISGFFQEPLEVCPSETWGEDFLVPAFAEVIIEGLVQPGVREIVDPFGEVTRHYQAQCLRQVMEVTAITKRKDAIMQDIFSGHEEHWNLGGLPKEGSVYNAIKSKLGNVVAVHFPHSGVGRLSCYISIKKSREGQAKLAGLVALNESWQFQTVVVVDDEVNVFNEKEVMWAIQTMVDPRRDIDLIHNSYSMFKTAMGHNKVIIDATRPLDVAFPSLLKVPDDAMERIVLSDWIDTTKTFV